MENPTLKQEKVKNYFFKCFSSVCKYFFLIRQDYKSPDLLSKLNYNVILFLRNQMTLVP